MSGRAAGALLALLALLAASASAGGDSATADGSALSEVPRAGTYELPPIARVGEYWLLDETGARAPLLGLDVGQVALISLIYTSCPSACPAALSIVQQVDREVAREPDLRESVRLVTVSFDPERDTPAKMAALRERLAPVSQWRFLTAASADGIRPVLDAFGQDALRLVVKSGPGGAEEKTPVLRHVLKLYLVDAAGDVRNIYSSGLMSPELLLADLRTVLIGERLVHGSRSE